MKKDLITSEILVKENKIGILRVGNANYISLTDLAKYQNSSDPSFTVKNWLRRINTIDYIGLWEELHNLDFNLVEFDQIKTEYGKNSFAMSPTQWIKRTNAIGIVSKGGRYSIGTYAHPDIAFEFASWLSPEFKLYLITEFERLKTNEAYQKKIDWQANRILSKLNYVVHTDAVKTYIVPTLTEEQKKFVYAEEADVLNVALFGMTAKEWRESNPELAKNGNIRDYTDLLHLVILNNLQNTNAELIEEKIPQSERLIRLNNSARRQMEVLKDNKSIKDLELLQKQVNEEKKLIIN
ncbi:MAG: KilA-N domain-containing protein [Bacilli bacterium]|nr:KilA-N domain-containing protein [Bacilli bacterium]MED9979411.1 KilA-N domain-containing protein [Bacilli bacterium]